MNQRKLTLDFCKMENPKIFGVPPEVEEQNDEKMHLGLEDKKRHEREFSWCINKERSI